jgi:acetaldehyde dehydrogenase/alcohol dehydrogenase
MPKALVAHTGYDALTHAVEAYVSVLASEFTRPYAREAIQLLHRYLLVSYETGDHEARKHVHYASTLAGYAIGNAFVGIAHSLAHQLGAQFELPHGVACALTLPEVVLYNSSDAPTRQAAFPQYTFPHAKDGYAEIADALALGGANSDEKVHRLYTELVRLRAALHLPDSLKAVIDMSEKDFALESSRLARNAFEDQCTLSNPRYPLVSELQGVLARVYRGTA